MRRGVSDGFPELDPGIAAYVDALRDAGVETFESCEGGSGHAYPEPTVRFGGGPGEGFRALAVAYNAASRSRRFDATGSCATTNPTVPTGK